MAEVLRRAADQIAADHIQMAAQFAELLCGTNPGGEFGADGLEIKSVPRKWCRSGCHRRPMFDCQATSRAEVFFCEQKEAKNFVRSITAKRSYAFAYSFKKDVLSAS